MASVVKSEFQTFKILLVLIIPEANQNRASKQARGAGMWGVVVKTRATYSQLTGI